MITTYSDRRERSAEYNLEVAGKEPQIELMLQEMEAAQPGIQWYLRRNDHAYDWAHSRWEGQTLDGRKHGEDSFPWENAADGRLRTVATIIGEHVTVAKWAYLNAKIQARALRPVAHGRESKKATTLLTWVIYTQLRAELQRELPLAWWWRFCYGAALLKIDWEQSRRLEMFPLKLEDLQQLVQASASQQQTSPDAMLQVLEAIMDPEQEDAVATLIQGFSEILSKGDARKIVVDLREKGAAEIPIARVYKHKPRVTARRPGIDVLFPPEMDDPQSPSTRWMAEREPVTETELRDRVMTEGYDPEFVNEALKHKGKFSNADWLSRTMQEREQWSGGAGWNGDEAFKHMVELIHFYHYRIDFKTPCLYHTIFSAHVRPKTGDKEIYAKSMPYEYDHGQLPFIGMRRQIRARSLLSSMGIAEEAYTDEQALKTQQDGMTDRTSLVNKPPLVVPQSRALAIQADFGPGAVMGVTRSNEISWMQLPPADQTPLEVMRLVTENLDRRYALFGAEVDAELKAMRKQETANDIMIEVELMIGQVFMLLQQYKADDEVEAVTGPLSAPFHVNRAEIQGAHTIIAAIDMKMLDDEYAQKKLQMVMEGIQAGLNQGGIANINKLFEWWLNAVDPDLADAIVEDQSTATDREKKDEMDALSGIMSGIDQPFPKLGNHQLRLQTLLGATVQSQNPEMAKRLMQNPDSLEMIKTRIKFFQNQIQQYQVNPTIGRMLTTKTFDKGAAPEMAPPVQ